MKDSEFNVIVLPFKPRVVATKCICKMSKKHVVFDVVLPFKPRVAAACGYFFDFNLWLF